MVNQFIVYNDDTRMATPTEDGVTLPPRPYTDEENAAADIRQQEEANYEQILAELAAQVPDLLTTIDALQVISDKTNAQITPNDTKTVARETRKLARQVVRLTRIVGDVLNSTSSGPTT